MAYRNSDTFSKEAYDTWDPLEQAIDKIYKRQKIDLSYMDLYNKAYNLAINNFGDAVYQNLKKNLLSYFKMDSVRISAHKDPQAFLYSLNETWVQVNDFLKSITSVFDYMHTKFIPRSRLSPLTGLGYQIFREIFIQEKSFCEELQRNILNMIHEEREGNMIDKTLLMHVIRMMRDLGSYYEYPRGVRAEFNAPKVTTNKSKPNAGADEQAKMVRSLEIYKSFFEIKFLEETEKYCTQDAESSASKLSPIEYLKRTEERFQSEIERANFYLDASSKPLLIETFVCSYIISKVQNVVDSVFTGLCMLFEEENPKDTKKILEMFNQNPLSKESFNQAFIAYEQKGLETVLAKDEKGAEEKEQFAMVKNLINLRKKCQSLLKLFHDCEGEASKVKGAAVDGIYEKLINASRKVVMELNAYLDYLFREGFKSSQDQEIENKLDEVMDVFRYIRDRDIFEKGYSFFLSKRLLTIKNINQEAEKLFVGKLKQECGAHFTNKMETMFTDINVSKDVNTDFQNHIKNSNANQTGLECFEVRVLTLGNWPNVNRNAYNIPEEISSWTESFKIYYQAKYQGRQLEWVLSLGNAELRSMVGGKKKEFVVSTIQMIVLLLFNSQKSITVDELTVRTKISLEDLETHLLGLLGVKLLKKSGESKEILEEDELSLNETFAHKEYRVRVPLSKKKKDDDASQNMDKLAKRAEGERKLRVEACIVRIMKARRSLKNNELLAEVMKMSNIYQFKPETKLIKEAIEGLIEKDYLKRDESDRSIYHYIS